MESGFAIEQEHTPPGRAWAPAAQTPAPLTPLVARDEAIAAVVALVQRPDVRLVTLTGPGGVGKTRLAIAVANAWVRETTRPVAFVGLAPVRDAALIPAAIAYALGIIDSGSRSSDEAIAHVIGDRELLLVLDNYEHVLEAALLAPRLLAACPGLTVLATSRAPLRVSGEREHPVAPLPVPAPELNTWQAIAAAPAVQLFVARASAVDPAFRLTDDNAGAVAGICVRLDGLPLAIELAAARSKVLSPALLLPRLARQLPLLTGGPRDAPARLQTMTDAIAWSYDLLRPHEQRIFRDLAVFVGGFTLEAAEAVLTTGDSGESDVLAGISTLLDQNLIRRYDTEGGAFRFGMLEPIREFALDRLLESGVLAALQERAASYYLAYIETASPQLIGPDQVRWLKALNADLPNLRVVLNWLIEQDRLEDALRLATDLGPFWVRHQNYSEGRRYLQIILDRYRPPLPTPARAAALVLATELTNWQGYHEQAIDLAREAHDSWQALGDPDGVATALWALGTIAIDFNYGPRARTLLEESVALSRTTGHTWNVVSALDFLGVAAYAEDDLPGAAAHFAEGLVLARQVEDLYSIAQLLGDAAHVALMRDDLVPSAAQYVESLAMHIELGAWWDIGWCLAGFAGLAARTERPEQAARLYGAAEAIFTRDHAPMRPSVQRKYESLFTPVQERLGREQWQALIQSGAALSLDAAIAEGRQVAESVEQRLKPAALVLEEGDAVGIRLTARETDVLRQIVAGKTDREIAAMYFLSHRTIQDHVSNLIRKLGVVNRTEAASRAVRDGLIA